jgi:chemotaxis protein CheZ
MTMSGGDAMGQTAQKTEPPAVTDAEGNLDYHLLKAAVLRTARGRWFLTAFTSEVRAAETERVLGAIANLGRAVTEQASSMRLEVLQRELQEMAGAIAKARQDIAAIRPADETAAQSTNNRILAATEELDAIVTATERATTEILGAAERIQEVSSKLRESGADTGQCDTLDAQVMDIFTACSFQDITGQRTTKVVNVLRYLENRVNTMLDVWGELGTKTEKINQMPFNPKDTRPDAHLMSGPPAAGEGIDQSAVDEMFGGDADADEAMDQCSIDSLFD